MIIMTVSALMLIMTVVVMMTLMLDLTMVVVVFFSPSSSSTSMVGETDRLMFTLSWCWKNVGVKRITVKSKTLF